MTLVEARRNWSSHLRQSSPSRKNFIEEFSAFSCCLGAYLYNLTQYNVERDGVQSSKMEREQGREQELAEWGRYMEYISHLGNVGDDGTVGLIRNSMVVEWVDPGVGTDTRGRACIDYNLPRRSRLQHGILRYGVSTWITKAKPWIDVSVLFLVKKCLLLIF